MKVTEAKTAGEVREIARRVIERRRMAEQAALAAQELRRRSELKPAPPPLPPPPRAEYKPPKKTQARLTLSLSQEIKVREVLVEVSDYFKIPIKTILSDSRLTLILRPRSIAMYLARQVTGATSTQIGWLMRRDHSTVLHGAKAIEELLAIGDERTATEVNEIKTRLARRMVIGNS